VKHLLYLLVPYQEKYRRIGFYKNYFEKFFEKQRQKVKDKIIWTFNLIEEVEKVPDTYLRHITNAGGLYEIRVKQGSDIFCFFDQGQLVILINGFQKKTQKTPKKEIERALKLMRGYEIEKNK